MKIYQHLFSLSIERLIPALVQTGVHLYLARELGPMGYQPLAVIALIVQLSFPLIDLTLSQSVMVKKCVANSNINLFSNISLIIWIISIFVSCVVIVLSNYYSIGLTLALSYLFVVFGQGQTVLQKTNLLLVGKVNILRNIQLKTSFFSVLVFISCTLLINNLLLSFSIYLVFASILQIYLIHRADKYYPPKWSGMVIIKPLAKLSATLIFISGIAFLFENYLAFYVQKVGFNEVVISTLFLTRRFWGIAALTLADPVERASYISEDNESFRRMIGAVTAVAILGPALLYFTSEQMKTILLYIIGSNWSNMSSQLLAGSAYIFIFPLQGYMNFVLKRKEKNTVLIIVEILRRGILMCLLLLFSHNLTVIFCYQYVFGFVLLMFIYFSEVKWK